METLETREKGKRKKLSPRNQFLSPALNSSRLRHTTAGMTSLTIKAKTQLLVPCPLLHPQPSVPWRAAQAPGRPLHPPAQVQPISVGLCVGTSQRPTFQVSHLNQHRDLYLRVLVCSWPPSSRIFNPGGFGSAYPAALCYPCGNHRAFLRRRPAPGLLGYFQCFTDINSTFVTSFNVHLFSSHIIFPQRIPKSEITKPKGLCFY